MSFLFPAMLAGLAALAVPVALHLIARHRFPVQDFPSLRLLQGDIRNNVFAVKLVDVGQLLLRLAVLVLLALAMSRLFAPGFSSEVAPRNVVIVIDGSGSMKMQAAGPDGKRTALIDLARRKAREALATVVPPGQSAVVLAGPQVQTLCPLEGGSAAATAVLEQAAATDGAGCGLVAAVARACEMLQGRREVKSQVIVLTDLRASAFDARSQRDLQGIARARGDLGDRLEIAFVDLSGALTENVAVVDAFVRGGQGKMGEDAHVVATVANQGQSEQTAKVRLAIGNKTEPLVKELTLAAGEQAAVDLTARMNRPVRTVAQVLVDSPGARAPDAAFAVPLEVADARRLLIVNGSLAAAAEGGGSSGAAMGKLGASQEANAPAETQETVDGSVILKYALNPGRELGKSSGTNIHTTVLSPEAMAGQPLSKYDVIVLYDVSSLSEQSLGDLDSFVRQGRSVLIVCSGGASAMRFNRSLAAGSDARGALAPAELGNDLPLPAPTQIAVIGNSHPVLAPFRDRLKGDLAGVQFTHLREVRNLAAGASVMMKDSADHPLAVEMPLGLGRVVMLTFGFELDRGSLARTRVFPALMWRMMEYLTNGLRAKSPDVLAPMRPAVLDVSEPEFQFVSELELTAADSLGQAGKELTDATQPAAATAPATGPAPEGPAGAAAKAAMAPMRLAISPDKTILTGPLPVGHYLLHKVWAAGDSGGHAGYARHLIVNGDPREGQMARQGPGELVALMGPEAVVLSADQLGRMVPHGAELWTAVVLLLVALYVAEGVVGWILSARREKQRAAAGGQQP